MSSMSCRLLVGFFSLLIVGSPVAAQTQEAAFQAGAHLAIADSGQFGTTDIGVGGRLSWHPRSILGVEGEVTVFGDPFTDGVQFSAGRVEALFGATVGPRVGPVRVFAKLRPGLLRYRAAEEPIACILIFPPPLSCTLAAGRTLFALDAGGGLDVYPSAGTFIRVDAGDRIVRYPAPVFDAQGEVQDESFAGHDFRFSIGAGIRF